MGISLLISGFCYVPSHYLVDSCSLMTACCSQIQQLVVQRVSKSLAAHLTEEREEDEDIPNIPGAAVIYMHETMSTGDGSGTCTVIICFTECVTNETSKFVIGFVDFLTTLVNKELDGLPRGVVRSAQRSAAMSGPMRILTGLSAHLKQLYDKPLRPGLSKHMAGVNSSPAIG